MQAAHATLQASLDITSIQNSVHPHLILCQANDLKALANWYNKIINLGLDCALWREPDLDNQPTAICSGIVYDRKPFSKLKLWKG